MVPAKGKKECFKESSPRSFSSSASQQHQSSPSSFASSALLFLPSFNALKASEDGQWKGAKRDGLIDVSSIYLTQYMKSHQMGKISSSQIFPLVSFSSSFFLDLPRQSLASKGVNGRIVAYQNEGCHPMIIERRNGHDDDEAVVFLS